MKYCIFPGGQNVDHLTEIYSPAFVDNLVSSKGSVFISQGLV